MNTGENDNPVIISYYREMNAEKRQSLLQESFCDPKTEADNIRERLWIARYGKRKPRTDAFVGYLMNLKYIAESGITDVGGKKKKLAIDAINGMNLYDFENRNQMEQEIILLELKHTFLKYIDISANGRGFTSVVFGMGQLSDESIAQKIAEQFSTIAYTAPHIVRMDKEFAPLQKAMAAAFREAYPNRKHFLKKG